MSPKYIEEVVFATSVMKKWKDGWALFTKEPLNQKGYIWWVKSQNVDGFTLSPMWVKETHKKILPVSFDTCMKLAMAYEEFSYNSEY